EVRKVIELAGEARKVADAVVIAVVKRTNVRLIDDGVLVPEVIHRQASGRRPRASDPPPFLRPEARGPRPSQVVLKIPLRPDSSADAENVRGDHVRIQ